jgi:predicted nucleotidyltransferase
MRPSTPSYTPYPDINEVLQLLAQKLQQTLKDKLFGLYLYGSLASGDFNPQSSDIDFVVVTTEELPESIHPVLEALHRRIWDSGLEWAKKLEGTYFPVKSMHHHNLNDPPRPHVNESRFFVCRQETDWIINRDTLFRNGVVITGPPPRSFIAPVTAGAIRRCVIEGLRTDWSPRLDDRAWLQRPANQAFVVLTNCRALYTLRYGTVKSKPVSARWALKTLGKRWHSLITAAMQWQHGLPAGNIELTLDMMRYTWEKAQTYESRLPGNP